MEKIDYDQHYCKDCEKVTLFRWLTDEDSVWKPGEEPIYICCECGDEFSEEYQPDEV